MSADREHQQREENPHEGPSHSFGVPSDRSAAPARTEQADADRERAIQTSRDRDRTTPSSRESTSSGGAVARRFTPFTLMQRMAEDMDRLFDGTAFGSLPRFGDLWSAMPGGTAAAWAPQVETFRRGDRLVVRADLPGLDKKDVQVDVSDGVLSISGERRDEREDERDDYFATERSYGRFFRALPLPEGVSGDGCEAEFRDGVLEVSFPAPKRADRSTKRIPVR